MGEGNLQRQFNTDISRHAPDVKCVHPHATDDPMRCLCWGEVCGVYPQNIIVCPVLSLL